MECLTPPPPRKKTPKFRHKINILAELHVVTEIKVVGCIMAPYWISSGRIVLQVSQYHCLNAWLQNAMSVHQNQIPSWISYWDIGDDIHLGGGIGFQWELSILSARVYK